MPTLNVPQYKFLQSKAKFRAFVAGYGAGKTWVGSEGLLEHFRKHPKVDASYFAPTYKLVKGVFWPTIEEVGFNAGFDINVKVGDHEVHVKYNGRHYGVIHCRTMDNPENIVGFKSGHSLVDELDILTIDKAKRAWQKIIARMRYKVDGLKNGVDVTTTPEGFKFTYERFAKEKMPNSFLIHASTYDNEANLPHDYIDTLLCDYPKELRAAYLRGEFTNLTSGTVYKNYSRKGHASSETIRDGEPLFIGMDFNVTKMACTIFVKRDGGAQWHAVDQIVDGYDTPDVIEIIKSRYAGHSITIYPDASGGSRKSVDASKSDISLLHSAGFSVRAHASNPDVKDRVLSVNSAFHRNVLFVNDRKCPDVADCLEQQTYDKNGQPDKKDGKDHSNDATGYPIAYEMPIIKPVPRINVSIY